MKRLFIRRALAYFLDLALVAVAFALIAVAMNAVFDFKVTAPAFFQSHQCVKKQILSTEKIEQLLPTTAGQSHTQVICKYSQMGLTTSYVVQLIHIDNADGKQLMTSLSYSSDENGREFTVYSIDPFMAVLAPFIFAFFILKTGKTPGKTIFKLNVFDMRLERPIWFSALKRELFKGLLFFLLGVFNIFVMYLTSVLSIEEQAVLLGKYATVFADNLGLFLVVTISVSCCIFWYLFGSFIAWNGQSYWDRWSGLSVGTNDILVTLRRDQQVEKL